MADRKSKLVLEIYKSLELRIIKIEKELKFQQELIKKLVICIFELSKIVKSLPDKNIRKSMAFKYPFLAEEKGLDLSIREDLDEKLITHISPTKELEQMSELSVCENEDFSVSFDTAEFLESLSNVI